MQITHSRDRPNTNYFLETPLKNVSNFTDLGITITRDLSWGNHISITVNKANKVLGSIKRSIATTDVNVFFHDVQIPYTQFRSMWHLFGVLTLVPSQQGNMSQLLQITILAGPLLRSSRQLPQLLY